MRFFAVALVFISAVVSVLGQTIEIGVPKNGAVLHLGKKFTAEIVRPQSIIGCIEVGIALALNNCNNGVCPKPSDQLGAVLYAGPFKPTLHNQGQFYQNFTLEVPTFMSKGPAIFSLTHLCLIGAGPFPLLEFRNVSVTIE